MATTNPTPHARQNAPAANATNEPVRDPGRVIWCPPAILRLCVVFCGLALFFGASMLMEPRSSQANAPLARAAAKRDGMQYGDSLLNPNAFTGAPGKARPTGAQPVTAANAQPFDANKAPIVDEQGNMLLGHLFGRGDLVVWIYSGPFSPLYTVVHKTNGVLAYGLEHDDVYRQFPELNIDALRMFKADQRFGTPIMHADTDRE